jgi:hypothetical protein
VSEGVVCGYEAFAFFFLAVIGHPLSEQQTVLIYRCNSFTIIARAITCIIILL